MQDPLRRGDEAIGGDVAARHALVRAELVELDVEAHEIAALPRDDQDAALVRRVDRRLEPDVGEVRDREHVHHAPGLVRRVAAQLPPERAAHRAARPVAADDVAGPNGLDPALVLRIHPLDPHRHRVVRRLRLDRKVEQAARVVRREPRRRVPHRLEEEVVHPRLVQDHVRELGKPVLGVLDAAAAVDRPGPLRVGLPERRLVDPVGLAHHPLDEAEGVEHLHGAAGDAVGLAELERAVLLVDDPGADLGGTPPVAPRASGLRDRSRRSGHRPPRAGPRRAPRRPRPGPGSRDRRCGSRRDGTASGSTSSSVRN